MVGGQVLAGRGVRLAAARHLRDLATGPTRGLAWRPDLAHYILEFFARFLVLPDGEHAGQPFVLQPWSAFIVGSLFGWLGADGYRRFRTAYVEVGKGNGKTPIAAGIGLYGLLEDDEPGAQIYSAAVGFDQAMLCWRDADRMVAGSPSLAARVGRTVRNLAVAETGSFFRPVSSEHRQLDGKRVHIALVDELHEHTTDLVVDKMQAGTKGRRQAVIVEITNSGYDRQSVCFRHHEYSLKVLDGALQDDAWFAYVCQLDACAACRAAGHEQPQEGCAACDDWRDEAVWPKANPNLGYSVTARYLREQVTRAIGMPASQNLVKRLNCCLWTEGAARWLPADAWAACGAAVELATLRGRRAYGGLDLASKTDTAAWALLFPPDDADPTWTLTVQFFLPAANLAARVARDRVPYDVWAREGWLTLTPGNVIDEDFILAQIRQDAERYAIAEIAYDRWGATSLVTRLQADGATVVPLGQGFQSLSAPTRELEVLVTGRRAGAPDGDGSPESWAPPALRHDGNPVLVWQVANVVLRTDPAGNIKPDREASREKIDGVVAAIMALARAMVAPDPAGELNRVLERRGLVVV